MSAGPVGVVVVGAGVISAEYLRTLTALPDVRVLGVADVDVRRAAAVAAEHGVAAAGDVETVLALDGAELVVNLTPPAAHAAVTLTALAAGRHVYSEKPLALTPAEADRLLAEAARRRLRVGCAPDTFLGAGIQTAARALADGLIGAPVAVSTVAMGPGPDRWHPRPQFLFDRGAGPLFDLGPYHLTALAALFGPIARVAACARRGRDERVVATGPAAGTRFPVAVPTHVTALLDLADGTSAASTFSFDSHVRRSAIEITGVDGTLALGDPIFFGGPVRVRTARDDDWRALPVTVTATGRGIGVLEMARALRTGAPHRAAGELGRHALAAMTAIAASAERSEFTPVAPGCARPALLPAGWDPGERTLGA